MLLRINLVFTGMIVVNALASCIFSQQELDADPAASQQSAFVQRLPREEQVSPVASFVVSLTPEDAKASEVVTVTLEGETKGGWHIYPLELKPDVIGFPTKLTLTPSGMEPIGEIEFAGEDAALLGGKFSWKQQYRVTRDGNYALEGVVEFQACNDQQCMPPKKLDFNVGRLSPDANDTMSTSSSSTTVEVDPNEKPLGEPIVVSLEPCELTRTRPQIGLSMVLFGRGTDTLNWKGSITIASGQSVDIYLPKARKYKLKNTGQAGTIADNTATYISIDQDGDGTLAEWEANAVNRPIRIHDEMFRVVDINVDDQTMTLQALDLPLQGSLIGRRCPDFEFTTIDGETVSNKTILGTVTVLDVWAVTCHNCYEGFPVLQQMRDKYSPEKLQVYLLTVDTDRAFYDSLAPGIFANFGGGKWPQVMLPGGFAGGLVLGDYGFGSVVVDEQGTVRAIGVHKHNAAEVLDGVLGNALETTH